MKKIIFVGLVLLVGFQGLAQGTNSTAAAMRVLFAGNSYVQSGNLPQVVAALASDKGVAIETGMSVAGGATLEDHLKGMRKLNTMEHIQTGGYHVVVLQDQSLRPVTDPEGTIRDVGSLCEPIRAAGAEPILFLTWARERVPQMQQKLTEAYQKAAQIHGARVVPVGAAWEMARRLRPTLALYSEDGSHPSSLGTYLSACVFFAALTEGSAMGLTHHPVTTDQHGEPITLMWIHPEDATFCQLVADEIVGAVTFE